MKHVNQLAGRDLITGDPLRLTGGKAEGGRGAVRETLEWEIDQNSRVQPNRVHLGVVGRKFCWVHALEKDDCLPVRLVQRQHAVALVLVPFVPNPDSN